MKSIVIKTTDSLIVQYFDEDKEIEVKEFFKNDEYFITDYPPSIYHVFDWESKSWLDKKAYHYQELRKYEYPPIEDYIDGIVKGDQEQINKYIANCLAVKAKYPKPSDC